jgi:sialate O-acetylesterase
MYNAMIHPLVPFAIRGAVWYQGESNLGEGQGYLERKKALIGGWRKVWNQGDFPFYTVQLAPFNYGNQPREQARQNTALPEIQEAQNDTLTQIPNTGVAVINDIGNFSDIHPANKLDVGRRLSLIALVKDYGRANLVYSGPVFAGATPENGKLRLKFTSTGSGLASRDGKPLREFEVAGPDGKFLPAEAVVEGSDVLVSSAAVPAPIQVRHAWNQIPEANLINKEGLPASAFRTR